ncbi:TetR/AcrR family transcriptional regulator [Actinomadura chibensis]|uniref:TetR/AcrR family transcriptional regulator n=1 Tax=Actinomadura chibensis TaxID=392828 RepID=A0A5D0P0A3_9ACTN|nr:TetR/AcrR family transcriptional regulator [Actinomadura chibensis]TYB49721.1 TetR/AcrR family transcriptional regulator [Actinomadura chibensis]
MDAHRSPRGRATRDQLVAIATRLFAERGYEGASIGAVLDESGLSKGALYHHFDGKDALFAAVLESVEADISRKLARAAADAPDPRAALHAGCLAWVRLAGDPVVRRIVLIDAPSVLGWQRWREIEERYGFGMVKTALRAVADQGTLPADLVDPFAHMLLAALNETALTVARSADRPAATKTAESAVTELLARLLPEGPAPAAGRGRDVRRPREGGSRG